MVLAPTAPATATATATCAATPAAPVWRLGVVVVATAAAHLATPTKGVGGDNVAALCPAGTNPRPPTAAAALSCAVLRE